MIKKLEAISLKRHPKLNEKWVQEQIAADPTLLGLGDVEEGHRTAATGRGAPRPAAVRHRNPQAVRGGNPARRHGRGAI
jgi:hypothetical protein